MSALRMSVSAPLCTAYTVVWSERGKRVPVRRDLRRDEAHTKYVDACGLLWARHHRKRVG